MYAGRKLEDDNNIIEYQLENGFMLDLIVYKVANKKEYHE